MFLCFIVSFLCSFFLFCKQVYCVRKSSFHFPIIDKQEATIPLHMLIISCLQLKIYKGPSIYEIFSTVFTLAAQSTADMRHLTTGTLSEKCVVRRFRRCANVYLHKPRQYTLLHTQAIWYKLLLLGYKPAQHVSVLNTRGNCNTMISIILLYYNIIIYNIIILYYNLMVPPSYMLSVVDRNAVMWRIPVFILPRVL